MATVADHLHGGQKVRVLQTFVDRAGRSIETGMEFTIEELDMDGFARVLTFRLAGGDQFELDVRTQSGPRSGHMREYFEDLSADDREPVRVERPQAPQVIPEPVTERGNLQDAAARVVALAAAHRFEEADEQIRVVDSWKEGSYLWPAMGTALGNQARTLAESGDIEAFDWIWKRAFDYWYAWGSSATSGGEGTARMRDISGAEALHKEQRLLCLNRRPH